MGGTMKESCDLTKDFFVKCEMHCKFQGKSGIDSDTPLVTVGLTPYKTNNDVHDGDIHHTLIQIMAKFCGVANQEQGFNP